MAEKEDKWILKLYIAGVTPRSSEALINLKKICEEYLQGRYIIEVIDLQKNPQLAEDDQIIAVPTLVRSFPEPIRMLIGDLSDKEKVLRGLNLVPLGQK